MKRQRTLAAPVTIVGAGLHTGRRARVTLHPAPADHGITIGDVPVDWTHRVPSRMSTSIGLGGGRTLRTIEHLMAALGAYGIDALRIEADGPEVPILDGSAAPWCRALRRAGLQTLAAPARAIRPRRAVQIVRDGGVLRVEPAGTFAVDVTHDLLPAFPVMRWTGEVEASRFDADLARARSFGNLHRRLGLTPPAVPRPPGGIVPHRPDPGLPEAPDMGETVAIPDRAPLLRGWRPWRATLVAGARIIPPRRFPDEPVRHVALDMIGDLGLAGAPLLARVTAHNPSHEKTYLLVAALMRDPANWEHVTPAA